MLARMVWDTFTKKNRSSEKVPQTARLTEGVRVKSYLSNSQIDGELLPCFTYNMIIDCMFYECEDKYEGGGFTAKGAARVSVERSEAAALDLDHRIPQFQLL